MAVQCDWWLWMSLSRGASRSGAEYIIRQIKEVAMPQETCRNGFRGKEKSVGDKSDQDKEGEGKCERQKATEGYF